MTYFGQDDPRQMPKHLFYGALDLDYESAVRGNLDRQNFSICPRHWYVDATFRCDECDRAFLWSAEEQQKWFEVWRFWVDSSPNHCRDCRQQRRSLIAAKQEYDRLVSEATSGGSLEVKGQVLELLAQLEAGLGELSDAQRETQRVLLIQIERDSEADL